MRVVLAAALLFVATAAAADPVRWAALAQQYQASGDPVMAVFCLRQAERELAEPKVRIVYDRQGNMYNLYSNGAMTLVKLARP